MVRYYSGTLGDINRSKKKEDLIVKQETRQVIDIPKPEVTTNSHLVTVLECPCCGAEIKGEFPKDVKAPVQYGINLKAYVVYLMIYQLIPYKRTTDLLKNLQQRNQEKQNLMISLLLKWRNITSK